MKNEYFISPCCSAGSQGITPLSSLDRREFLRVTALGAMGATLSSFTPDFLAAKEVLFKDWDPSKPFKIPGKALRVQPVFIYHIMKRREQTSWRPWGSIYTEQGVSDEVHRVSLEISGFSAASDFPLEILPVIKVREEEEAAKIPSNDFDVVLLFAASGSGQLYRACTPVSKDTIVFVRHMSGPLYQWYQVLSMAFLATGRQGYPDSNSLSPAIHVKDVVVDDYDELLWRLRALYGVKNFLG